jgi:hypothetical protein
VQVKGTIPNAGLSEHRAFGFARGMDQFVLMLDITAKLDVK